MKAVYPFDPIIDLTPEEAEELNVQSGPHFFQTRLFDSSLYIVFSRRGWLAQHGFSGDLLIRDPRLSTPIVPDLCVIKSIPHDRLNQVKTYTVEKGHPAPRVVIEVGSDFPNERDYKDKKAKYQRMGVPEYFIFDLIHRELVGYRLVGRKYKEIEPNAEGRLYSIELSLEFGHYEGWARLWEDGQWVPVAQEVWDLLAKKDRQLRQKDRQLRQKDRELSETRRRVEAMGTEVRRHAAEIEALRKLLKDKGIL